MCAFGCVVHANRTILEKINICEDYHLYRLATVTRRVTTVLQRWQSLYEMTYMGGNSKVFSMWMKRKFVENVLCFKSIQRDNIWTLQLHNLIHNTKPNESENNAWKITCYYNLSHVKIFHCAVLHVSSKKGR